MPSYRTHDRVAYITAPVIMLGAYQLTRIETAIGIGIGFLAANHYLSPDLDIDSIMNRRWGILRFIWYPYKKLFHHRSFWTHSGPISATVRFIYLSLWLLPLLYFYVPPIHIVFVAWVVMVLADTLHTVLDKLL